MWLRQFFLGALSEFSALSPGIIMQILLTDLHTIHKCCLEELGLSLLLVLILAPRGFSPATPVFSSHKGAPLVTYGRLMGLRVLDLSSN